MLHVYGSVLEKGFAWNGKSYGSLSRVVKAMTSTSWNGGLRHQRSKAAPRHNARRPPLTCVWGARNEADDVWHGLGDLPKPFLTSTARH